MAAVIPRLVCWANTGEWMDVRTWFFGDEMAQKRACERVKAWSARGKLPLGVEVKAHVPMCVWFLSMHLYIYECVCMCVCVCVWYILCLNQHPLVSSLRTILCMLSY